MYICDGITTQIGLSLFGVNPSGMDTDIAFVPGPVIVNVFDWRVAGPVITASFEMNSIFFMASFVGISNLIMVQRFLNEKSFPFHEPAIGASSTLHTM